MPDLATCAFDLNIWIPTLITFGIVSVALAMLTTCCKCKNNKDWYVTLLPCRVIILGILWSESPGKESVQLDISFNEVSVSVIFLVLIKNFIESRFGQNGKKSFTMRPFLCFENMEFTTIVVLTSFVALMPAFLGVIYQVENQYAMGVLSVVLIVLLLSQQTKQTRPTESIKLTFGEIIGLSLIISSLTLISSFADCLGGEGWVGLICAYPIDATIIFIQFLTSKKKESAPDKIQHLHQIIYLIAVSCYIHFTMTTIIWASTKLDFLQTLGDAQGIGVVVPFLIITVVSIIIVFAIVDSVGFVKRIERSVENTATAVKTLLGGNTSDETSTKAWSSSATKFETFDSPRRKYEMDSLHL